MFSINFNSILFGSFYDNKPFEFALDRSYITDGCRRSNSKHISRSAWSPPAVALCKVKIDLKHCNINYNVLIYVTLIHIGCLIFNAEVLVYFSL